MKHCYVVLSCKEGRQAKIASFDNKEEAKKKAIEYKERNNSFGDGKTEYIVKTKSVN